MGAKVQPVFNISTQNLKGTFSEEKDQSVIYTKIEKIEKPDLLTLNMPSFNFMSSVGHGTKGTISYFLYDSIDPMVGFIHGEFKHPTLTATEAISFYQDRPCVKVTGLFPINLPFFNAERQLTVTTRNAKMGASTIAMYNLLSFMTNYNSPEQFESQNFLVVLNRLNYHLVDKLLFFDEVTGARRNYNEIEQELDDIIQREPLQIVVELAKLLHNMMFRTDYNLDLPILYEEFEVQVVQQKFIKQEAIAGGCVRYYEYFMPLAPQPTFVEIKMSNDMNNFSILLRVN